MSKKSSLQKVLVVLGQTASGKSALALKLAKKFNGELINADSRQVYKEMKIATAKESNRRGQPKTWLLDVVSPKDDFSAAEFKKLSIKAIDQILAQKKLPIVVGGTGLYLSALLDNLEIPAVKVNLNLRKKLEKMSLNRLAAKLKKLDFATYKRIDKNNPRRLIRALEVCLSTGRPLSLQQTRGPILYNFLKIGLCLPKPELESRINQRVELMFKKGIVAETKKLLKKYSLDLPALSSIGYREVSAYLAKKISREEAVALIQKNTRNYAKRQATWFKKVQGISWIKDYKAAEKLVKDFLQK